MARRHILNICAFLGLGIHDHQRLIFSILLRMFHIGIVFHTYLYKSRPPNLKPSLSSIRRPTGPFLPEGHTLFSYQVLDAQSTCSAHQAYTSTSVGVQRKYVAYPLRLTPCRTLVDSCRALTRMRAYQSAEAIAFASVSKTKKFLNANHSMPLPL